MEVQTFHEFQAVAALDGKPCRVCWYYRSHYLHPHPFEEEFAGAEFCNRCNENKNHQVHQHKSAVNDGARGETEVSVDTNPFGTGDKSLTESILTIFADAIDALKGTINMEPVEVKSGAMGFLADGESAPTPKTHVEWAEVKEERRRREAQAAKQAAAYGYGDLQFGVYSSSPQSANERVDALKAWWVDTAENDIEMVAEKAVTYGSNSLEQLGRKVAQLNGRRDLTAQEAQELGCWVNAVQKMERWTDAVMRGERPKDDTIVDLMCYSMMVRRIRHAGGWPDGRG